MTSLMFLKFCAEVRKVRARCVTMELLITNGRVPNMLLPVSNRKHSRARGHGRHIDHVYIGSVCRDVIHVTDARVVTDCVEHGVFASDHFPIVVNLNIL